MKKLIIPLLLLLMANFTFAQTSTPPTAGDGTAGNPWQIATLDNLYWLSQTPAEWGEGKYFVQTADIDAAATSTWDSNKGFSPIGNDDTKFVGNYDGQEHSITGLTINRETSNDQALFGITDGGALSNIKLINATVSGLNYVGILSGFCHSTVYNCSATGTVSGYDLVGGLVGFMKKNMNQSYANVAVSCTSSSNTSAGGGLIGNLDTYVNIRNCYALGAVTATNASYVGGLIGMVPYESNVYSSYSTGSVSSSGTNVGGFIGGLDDNGGSASIIEDCYWDTQTSGLNISAGGTGKTTAEMQTQSSYTNWDFDRIWGISVGNYPVLDIRNPTYSGGDGTVGAPYQIATIADLLTLEAWPTHWNKHFIQTADIDATDAAVSPIGNDANRFTGSYNGQNYSVDQFTYFSDGVGVGFFGQASGATLTNINLSKLNISAGYSFGGLLGLATNTTVENCFVTGDVSGLTLGGGMVGYSENSSFNRCGANVAVTGLDLFGDVTTLTHLGGFAGLVQTGSTFTDCYAKGSVSGYKIGGFVGGLDMMSSLFGGNQPIDIDMGFTLTNCYAANTLTVDAGGEKGGLYGQSTYTGSNITITNSFWDAEVTGTTEGYIGGTGKTTAEMKTQSTFTDWDFATTPIWKIDASRNSGFPYLAWQNMPIDAINISTVTSASSVTVTPLSDIVINSTGSLLIDQDTEVKTITVKVGGKLTINSEQTLTATVTLESSALGTGTLVDNYTEPTLTATVQQYLPQGRNWYISIPTSSGNTSSFIGAGLASSVSYYNEVGGAWVDDYTGAMTAGTGYVAISTAGAGSTTNNTSFSGTLNSGNVPVTLTRTGTGGFAGFNLIANPYPSYVNPMAAMKALDVEKTIWYRTKGAKYKFETVNVTSGVGTNAAGTGQVTGYIPPFQAFWVRTNVTGQELIFTNAMRNHANPTGVTTTPLKAPSVATQAITRLKINGNTGTDETVLYFNTAASNSFDDYDSRKMFEDVNITTPEIYTQLGSEKLVINGLNAVQYETEIPLGFITKQAGDFSISASEISNFETGTRLILKDKLYPNQETELSTEMAYNFSVSAATVSSNRFSLLFRAPSVATGLSTAEKLNAQVFVNAANQITIIAPEKVKYGIYNTMGQYVEGGITTSDIQTLNSKFTAGVYIVLLSGNAKELTTRVIIK